MPLKASFELLDKLLTRLKDTTDESPVNLVNTKYGDKDFVGLSDKDWSIMVSKLKADKMIGIKKGFAEPLDPSSNKTIDFFITFDGLMLLEMEGGYSGRLKTQRSSADHQLLLTRLIAVGTFLMMIFVGWQVYLSYHQKHCVYYDNNLDNKTEQSKKLPDSFRKSKVLIQTKK